jgi:capsid portal protein
MSSYAWINQIFQAAEVKDGAIVRRQIADVEKYGGGLQELLREVKGRGFHLLEIGDQYVIVCNQGQLKVHC